jgi:hypothetical protein
MKSKEPSVSVKMKKGIKVCETILGVEYKGKTFEEAKTFLDMNLPKIEGKDIREYVEPSDKMWRGIAFIQQMTGEEFTGTTMKDASQFISQNISKAKEVSNRRKH